MGTELQVAGEESSPFVGDPGIEFVQEDVQVSQFIVKDLVFIVKYEVLLK